MVKYCERCELVLNYYGRSYAKGISLRIIWYRYYAATPET